MATASANTIQYSHSVYYSILWYTWMRRAASSLLESILIHSSSDSTASYKSLNLHTVLLHSYSYNVQQHSFAILKNVHSAADQVYFHESNSKTSANLAARACGAWAAKFSLSQNHKDLKNAYFVENFLRPCARLLRTIPFQSKNFRFGVLKQFGPIFYLNNSTLL